MHGKGQHLCALVIGVEITEYVFSTPFYTSLICPQIFSFPQRNTGVIVHTTLIQGGSTKKTLNWNTLWYPLQ